MACITYITYITYRMAYSVGKTEPIGHRPEGGLKRILIVQINTITVFGQRIIFYFLLAILLNIP